MNLVQEAIQQLKDGKTLLYPTDTIWGLGCDATNADAVDKIMEIKKRPTEKSFIVLVDSIAMLERYVPEFPEVCYDLIDLAERPLTIIYDQAVGIAKNVLATDGSIGIRVTRDPICQQLIRGLRKPIVSTSANLSGFPNPTCYADVQTEIKDNVDHILLEKTDLAMTTPSQIIKIGRDSSIQIIRK